MLNPYLNAWTQKIGVTTKPPICAKEDVNHEKMLYNFYQRINHDYNQEQKCQPL